MMIEQDLEQIMLMKQQHVESFVESDDYDLDEADEAELIELLKLETFNDDIDVDPGDL